MSRVTMSSLPRRQLLTAGAALLLPACAFLNRPVPPQLYVLRPQISSPMGEPVRWRLSVGVPDAAASLDTARIALTRSPTTMDYFANAAWTDRLPLLLQRMLVQAFDRSGRIGAVDRDTTGLESDYLLDTVIQDFQARYDNPTGAPTIVIGLQAKLVRMPQREIAGMVVADQQANVGSNNLDAIVTAFNEATAAAVARIVGWTLSQPGPAPVQG